tara:strand:+ start:1642 stop:2508 length:867 start_codon:yes stop_codon:yes gene_type:complete
LPKLRRRLNTRWPGTMSARPPPPPYQLVKGDQFNFALGCLAAFVLGACKEIRGLPPFLKLQLRTYTIWNLTFCALRVALKQRQWDPFLLLNSIGIVNGFRTAFCQGIDENMRRKLESQLAMSGLPFPRWQFLLSDHLVHTVPPVLLLSSVIRRKQRVHPINAVYCMAISTWFAFRQGAQLDSSDIYVPHPWKRAWLAIFTSMLCTPPLVNGIIEKDRRKVLLSLALLLAPYLSARLDPNLRQKYNFEAIIARHQERDEEQQSAGGAAAAKPLPRCMSSPPPGLAHLSQ